MLETIREFAGEQLRAAGDADTARSAYYAWMLKLALAARHGLDGPEQPNWLRAIQEEHQNVREVLSLAIDNEDAELALEVVSALERYFWLQPAEAMMWYERALPMRDRV